METKHTPGPWSFSPFHGTPESIAEARKFGIEPVPALTNDGAAFIMAGAQDDERKRVALVDCQTPHKRGKGHETDCAERAANARLIAAAPDLLKAALAVIGDTPPAGESGHVDFADAIKMLRAAIAKATGET